MNPKDDTTYSSAHTDFSHGFSYAAYLELDQLLSAQHPLTAAHDEPLFIMIHQVQELWMKLLVHEFQSAMKSLEIVLFPELWQVRTEL